MIIKSRKPNKEKTLKRRQIFQGQLKFKRSKMDSILLNINKARRWESEGGNHGAKRKTANQNSKSKIPFKNKDEIDPSSQKQELPEIDPSRSLLKEIERLYECRHQTTSAVLSYRTLITFKGWGKYKPVIIRHCTALVLWRSQCQIS